jgi:hypothetical protein
LLLELLRLLGHGQRERLGAAASDATPAGERSARNGSRRDQTDVFEISVAAQVVAAVAVAAAAVLRQRLHFRLGFGQRQFGRSEIRQFVNHLIVVAVVAVVAVHHVRESQHLESVHRSHGCHVNATDFQFFQTFQGRATQFQRSRLNRKNKKQNPI